MSNKNIYNFDFGTLTEDELIKVSISKEQFSSNRKSDIEDLTTSLDDKFLPVYKVTEDDSSYHFYYLKESYLKNAVNIKKEEYPVKISLAEEILKQDIIHEYDAKDIFVSINPSTLYYKSILTIKYTYSANQFIPKSNYTALQMYKACIASIVSDIPYEKCLATPQDVAKEGNEFIKEIFDKNSVAELLNFITDSKDYIEYDYIQNRSKEKSKWKTLLISTASILTIAAISSALAINYINNNNREALANEYETVISNKDLTILANEQMENGEYAEAVKTYEKSGYDLSKVAERLIEKGEYQLALDTDESQLEKIITTLYENEDKELIRDLNSDNLSEGVSSKLENEKAIVNSDKNAMMNVLNFLDDENTAVRLTEEFVNQNDLTNAQKVQEKDRKSVV